MSNSLLEFANYQEDRDRAITPELRQVGHAIERRKEARHRWDNRPLRCKLGLHRRLRGLGGSYSLTCVICWRHEL